jgi:filamentous hemagglutinin
MKIPNNNRSYVADNKITDYLLSYIHEVGKHKAEFFKRFGFDIADIDTFRGSLIQHSIDRDIEKIQHTDFGTKYELKCEIRTPDKRNPCVMTVWIVENGKDRPTLVTAYPADRQ